MFRLNTEAGLAGKSPPPPAAAVAAAAAAAAAGDYQCDGKNACRKRPHGLFACHHGSYPSSYSPIPWKNTVKSHSALPNRDVDHNLRNAPSLLSPATRRNTISPEAFARPAAPPAPPSPSVPPKTGVACCSSLFLGQTAKYTLATCSTFRGYLIRRGPAPCGRNRKGC